ncbi:hypothetical protein [Sphingomonas sp. BK235]|uniref:hypothetical protein n=1 Tax=Sphingomonas sp. BK235 TaxID=2512131 RepID=UPI00104CE1B5|nr:hypothetical protein [Sphingomonas sp. BK235]TCP36073.1 hypothetical protein EV292_102664 [Sphingomonas sp. BK235]
MAYVALSSPVLPQLREAARPVLAAHDGSFSELERLVIAMSCRDELASIRDPADWRSRLGRLLGEKQVNRLADQRLEELRRYVVLCRGGRDPGDDALDRFLDAGFTMDQATHVQRGQRTPRRGTRNGAGRVLWSMLLLISLAVYLMMQSTLEEPAISAIGAGLVFVTLASLSAQRRRSHRMD